MCKPMPLASRSRWVLLASAVLSCFPALVSAQNPGATSVSQQLEMVIREYGERGLSLAQPIIERDLADQQRDTVRVTLAGGSTYVVYGACDQDCTELKMQVRDEAGAVLDSLTEMEDPILQMESPRTQEYRIIVSPICRMDPCRVGLAVFVVPPRPRRER